MTRTIVVSEQINANIKRDNVVDLDRQALTNEVGTVPDAVKSYITVTEQGDNLVHRTVLNCVDLPVTITDDPGVAQYGGVKVYTFPEGLIFSKGAVVSGNLTGGVTGTIIDAFTGVNALGTVVATTGSTLTGTEATWLQSTANGTAATKVAPIASVSVATALTESPSRAVDGSTTPAPIFLNFAIADDATHTSGTGTFTGTITFNWEKIGDK